MQHIRLFETEVDMALTNVLMVNKENNKVKLKQPAPKPTQPNNEIWYTTEDGNIFSIGGEEIGMQGYIDLMCNPDPEQGYGCVYAGPTIVEEVFEDDVWKIKFASDVTRVGAVEDYFDNPHSGIVIYPLFDGYEVGNNLVTVSLPQSVTIIDKTTFRSGKYITEFEAPSNVTTIGDYAFAICGWSEEGTAITLPSSITYLGKELFVESNITNLTYKGTIEQWNAIEKQENWNDSGSSSDPLAVKVVHCSDGDVNIGE